nr:hypothetical protein [Nonomuraea sp. ATCC 55076]
MALDRMRARSGGTEEGSGGGVSVRTPSTKRAVLPGPSRGNAGRPASSSYAIDPSAYTSEAGTGGCPSSSSGEACTEGGVPSGSSTMDISADMANPVSTTPPAVMTTFSGLTRPCAPPTACVAATTRATARSSPVACSRGMGRPRPGRSARVRPSCGGVTRYGRPSPVAPTSNTGITPGCAASSSGKARPRMIRLRARLSTRRHASVLTSTSPPSADVRRARCTAQGPSWPVCSSSS